MEETNREKPSIQTGQLVDRITTSVKRIFSTMISLGISEGEPVDQFPPNLNFCISGLVGIGGTQSGIVGLHLGATIAREITANMAGMAIDELEEPDDVFDAVGEITNMIAGEVKMLLQREHGELHLSIPTIISGRDYDIMPAGSNKCSLVVPFSCENGKILVSLRMLDDPCLAASGI